MWDQGDASVTSFIQKKNPQIPLVLQPNLVQYNTKAAQSSPVNQ